MDIEANTQMYRVEEFCSNYNIDAEGQIKLIELFNQCMVHVATGIMNLPGVKDTAKGAKGAKAKVVKEKKPKKEKVDRIKCSGKTKTGTDCKKYAVDGEDYCKTHIPKEEEEVVEPSPDTAECNAICANGSKCKQTGRMMTPEGAKFKYCFKHSKSWEKFEGEDDVSDSEPDNDFKEVVVLTEEQDAERVANGLEKDEYADAVDAFEIKEKTAESKLSSDKMEKWKKDNQINESNGDESEGNESEGNESKGNGLEKKKKVEVRTKQKRPSSWVKKTHESMLKAAELRKKQNKEMLENESDN